MTGPWKPPFYIKAPLIIIGLYATVSMLWITKDIVVPLIYAGMVAIALSPAVNFLVKKKIHRAIAILIVLLVAVMLAAGLITLLWLQASSLSDAWPQLSGKFEELVRQAVNQASDWFGISTQKINSWMAKAKQDCISNSSAAIGSTLTAMGNVLASAMLTPVYIFMILFYQQHLMEFIHKVFSAGHNQKVSLVLSQTKAIIQSYLVGLFAEFAIVAVLNSAGLLLLGIDYAILLGITGALLNVIPYIGGVIGVALFMAIALVTKPPVYVVYVLALYTLIQFIDNNYIVPKIIGSKVKLNPLISIIAVIAGAALWGIPGMFLSIPLMAVIKLIFDHIDPLKPWGFLLGDAAPVQPVIKFKFTIKGFISQLTTKKL